MDAKTLYYLIGGPILLFSEALLLIMLTHFVREGSLKLRSALYVVLISSMALSGITKFLAPYTGLLWGILISLSVVFLFIYGYLTENVHLPGKNSALIAVIYLAVDPVAKVLFVSIPLL